MANCDVCGGPDGCFFCGAGGRGWPSDVIGAHYGTCCQDKGTEAIVAGIRATRLAEQAQRPIGFTSSGEKIYGAGGIRVDKEYGIDLSSLLVVPTKSDLYDRVIAECEAAISAAILPHDLRFIADEKQDIVKTGVLKGRLEVLYPEMISMTIGFTPPTINCLSCTSPATHGNYCVYCEHRREREPIGYTGTHADFAAKRRNKAAFEREKPSSTATSRELAKGHPSTWPSQEGET